MIFNLFLKLVKAQTEEEKLKWSVIYGWSLVGIGILTCVCIGLLTEFSPDGSSLESVCATLWFISIILFMFRYTSVKPLLGAAAGGITVIAIGSILENLSNRRDNSLSMGALFGVIFILFLICLKNIFVSWYYLVRETSRYIKYSKKGLTLEATV